MYNQELDRKMGKHKQSLDIIQANKIDVNIKEVDENEDDSESFSEEALSSPSLGPKLNMTEGIADVDQIDNELSYNSGEMDEQKSNRFEKGFAGSDKNSYNKPDKSINEDDNRFYSNIYKNDDSKFGQEL